MGSAPWLRSVTIWLSDKSNNGWGRQDVFKLNKIKSSSEQLLFYYYNMKIKDSAQGTLVCR